MIDDKGAFYNGSESDNDDNDDENYNGNMEAVVRGFQIRIRKSKIRKFYRKPPVLEFQIY